MKSVFSKPNKVMPCFTIWAIIIFLIAGCAPAPANPSLSITSLQAEQEIVLPSGSCQIECTVSNPEGGELNYEWQASGGSISGEGAVAIWTTPDEPGEYIISVKVTDKDGNKATQSITISVRENHPPQINPLSTSDERVIPLGHCTITCDAFDPDDDKLSYEWSASGGSISGTGPVITWTAPETADTYTITVEVKDDNGGESTDSLTINVAPNNPPIIENLIATAEHRYLEEISTGYKILKGKNCNIECIASDPDGDELSYEWAYDGIYGSGNIPGEGPVVTWTAPLRGGQVTVTVTVSDNYGGVATKSIVFTVKTCGSCAF